MELPPRGPKESPCASHAPTRMQVRFGEGPRAAKPRNLCRRRRWARWGSGGVCSKGLHVRASVVTARAPAITSTRAPASSPRVRQPSARAPALSSRMRQPLSARMRQPLSARAPVSSPRMRQPSSAHVHQRRHRACASCPVVTAHAPAGVSTRASVVTVPRRELQSSTPPPRGPWDAAPCVLHIRHL